MNEEEKRSGAESETAGEEPSPQAQTGAPEQEPPAGSEPEKESGEAEKTGKKGRRKKDKEEKFTLTREQMEAAELAAKQLASVKDQFVRLTAEYDNYRKRTAKEKDTLYQDAKADTVREFLAVYDNLERAVSAEGGEDDPHKKAWR